MPGLIQSFSLRLSRRFGNSLGAGGLLDDVPNAAAAYSLRSLRGGNPAVVRVRRGSDNHEQDFTAGDVASGALTSFVNAQTTAPLDIKELTSGTADDGRNGDFIIAKAAYSLRSLGTRQATIPNDAAPLNADTVVPASGKYVVQVRRSSDDTIKSFTATEVTDGTLLSFVGTGGSDNGFVRTWYDQSVTGQDATTGTPNANHAVQTSVSNMPKIVSNGSLLADGIEFDGSNYRLVSSNTITVTTSSDISFSLVGESNNITSTQTIVSQKSGTGQGRSWTDIVSSNFRTSIGGSAKTFGSVSANGTPFIYSFILDESANTGDAFKDGSQSGSQKSISAAEAANGELVIGSNNGESGQFFNGHLEELIVYLSDQTDNRTAIEANIGSVYGIDLPDGFDPTNDKVNGFVETWYDQSGNGRDSTQTTAARQPIIVDAGTFQDGLKFTHDDTTNGKRLSVPRTALELGEAFALVWVGRITDNSDNSYNNVLGGTRGVSSFATGTAGLSIKPNSGTVAFINETSTTERVLSTSSTTVSLNTDAVIFATHEDQESGPDLDLSVNGNKQDFGFGSNLVLSSSKDIGIMHSSSSGGTYRIEESPVGICREVIVYDTFQQDNRVTLETNIMTHYGIS